MHAKIVQAKKTKCNVFVSATGIPCKTFFFGERIFQENRSVYSVFLMKIILNMFHKNIL